MSPFSSLFLGRRLLVSLCCVALGWTASALQALNNDDVGPGEDGPSRFHEVNAWRGTVVLRLTPVPASVDTLTAALQRGDRDTQVAYDYSEYQCFEFELTEYESDPSQWTGRLTRSVVEAGGRGYVRTGSKGGGGFTEQEVLVNGAGAFAMEEGDAVTLRFHREEGWSLSVQARPFDASASDRTLTDQPRYTGLPKSDPRRTERLRFLNRSNKTQSIYPLGDIPTLPYPKAPRMVLFHSAADELDTEAARLVFRPKMKREYAVYLEPMSMTPLQVVIEPGDDYETWRPATTPGREPGDPLRVRARVETTAGKEPKVAVREFVWELFDVSREPGVALNWPLEAKDRDPDLRLKATRASYETDEERIKITQPIEDGFRDEIEIEALDWGAWATLQVTAVMEDGRRIRGRVEKGKELGLRLPKREAGSHIAASWFKEHGGAADEDDDEKIEGQKYSGDGYTLYEEYRGWVVAGQHREGDPEKKDFFVLNLIGADAETGLDLFEAVSELKVHRDLQSDEMSEKERLMNGNRSRGAHRVAQHGVWLRTFPSKEALGDRGAVTKVVDAAKGLRPGNVEGIGILARSDAESVFAEPYNLDAASQPLAYDRAIAHELLHAVGVDHHGEKDYVSYFGFCSVKNPRNRLGRPYYGPTVDRPVELLTEEGEDLALADAADTERWAEMIGGIFHEEHLALARRQFADGITDGYATPEAMADGLDATYQFLAAIRGGVIGVAGGEHSGDEACLMRYYFAKAYESKQLPTWGQKQYYVVQPATEHSGLLVCRDSAGTGVNAKDRSPQARYGDATRGDCFSQICPNDAIPTEGER